MARNPQNEGSPLQGPLAAALPPPSYTVPSPKTIPPPSYGSYDLDAPFPESGSARHLSELLNDPTPANFHTSRPGPESKGYACWRCRQTVALCVSIIAAISIVALCIGGWERYRSNQAVDAANEEDLWLSVPDTGTSGGPNITPTDLSSSDFVDRLWRLLNWERDFSPVAHAG